jgi:hypothetical protein
MGRGCGSGVPGWQMRRAAAAATAAGAGLLTRLSCLAVLT